jgi:hypothetical protein
MAQRVEAIGDWVAAALLAGAVGFAVFKLFSPTGGVAASLATFLLGKMILGRVGCEESSFCVRAFEPARFDALAGELDELLLTDADRAESGGGDALMLDDVLAELEPDSRVVRLFDPSAMPRPGGFEVRIDQHLGAGPSQSPSPDASQALYDALAELRRSLR